MRYVAYVIDEAMVFVDKGRLVSRRLFNFEFRVGTSVCLPDMLRCSTSVCAGNKPLRNFRILALIQSLGVGAVPTRKVTWSMSLKISKLRTNVT